MQSLSFAQHTSDTHTRTCENVNCSRLAVVVSAGVQVVEETKSSRTDGKFVSFFPNWLSKTWKVKLGNLVT